MDIPVRSTKIYEDGTECSETSAFKIKMPGNYPEGSIQQSYTKLD